MQCSLDETDAQDVPPVAVLLDITEYRVFGLAYEGWFGRRSDDALIARYYILYM